MDRTWRNKIKNIIFSLRRNDIEITIVGMIVVLLVLTGIIFLMDFQSITILKSIDIRIIIIGKFVFIILLIPTIGGVLGCLIEGMVLKIINLLKKKKK